MDTAYVVDTTVLVSWLLSPNKLAGKIVRSLELQLYTPYMAVDELWRHRLEWSERRPDIKFPLFMDALRYYVKVIVADRSWEEYLEAEEAMAPIDPNDAEFLALALRLRIPIWSHDRHFREQSLAKVITSSDILRYSHELPTLWRALNEEARHLDR